MIIEIWIGFMLSFLFKFQNWEIVLPETVHQFSWNDSESSQHILPKMPNVLNYEDTNYYIFESWFSFDLQIQGKHLYFPMFHFLYYVSTSNIYTF